MYDLPSSAPNFSCTDAAKRALIARRSGYSGRFYSGYIPAPDDEPDAFVFTAEAAKASGIKVIREYRILNPAMHP